jgi:hypothetical protein
MTDVTCGPICGASNSREIDPGTLIRQKSHAPGIPGVRQRMCYPLQVQSLIFDADDLVRFCDSCAHARTMERHTRLIWKDYDESTFLNVTYAALNVFHDFGRPGYVEVESGAIEQVQRESREASLELQDQFTRAMARGAGRVVHFMETQEGLRRDALAFVQDTYREAQSLNSAIQAEVTRGIARLSLIKAAATITFKTMALAAGGWPVFFLGTGYDISLNVIKDWSQAGDAVLIGLWSKSWKKAVKDAAKNLANTYKSEAGDAERKSDWLARRLEKMEDELFEEGSKQARKMAKDSRKLLRAQQAAASARRTAAAMSAVKYGFFAWDMYKTVVGAGEDLRAAGYDSAWDGVRDAFR